MGAKSEFEQFSVPLGHGGVDLDDSELEDHGVVLAFDHLLLAHVLYEGQRRNQCLLLAGKHGQERQVRTPLQIVRRDDLHEQRSVGLAPAHGVATSHEVIRRSRHGRGFAAALFLELLRHLRVVEASVEYLEGGGLNGLGIQGAEGLETCLLYTSPSPRDRQKSRMPSSA